MGSTTDSGRNLCAKRTVTAWSLAGGLSAIFLLFAFIGLALPCSDVFGAVLNVPSPQYPTIQSAINGAAASGDTIQVAAGTYYENLTWSTQSIALMGAGAAVTTVDAGGTGRCLHLRNVPSTARIEGFTFTGGRTSTYQSGAGLLVEVSSPTLANNIITGNAAGQFGGGGGISLLASASTLTNNIITGNTTSYIGGGLFIGNWSSPTLANNTITGNSAGGGGGLCLMVQSSGIWPTTLKDNTITGNSANGGGGGIWIFYYTSPLLTLTGNTISDNTAGIGGGIWGYPTAVNGSVVFRGNVITRNTATTGSSGGLGLQTNVPGISVTLEDNTITDNSADNSAANASGGGVSLVGIATSTVTGNTISRNSAFYTGGLKLVGGSATITGNTISDNSASGESGGMFCQAGPSQSLTITDNVFTGNTVTGWSVGGAYVTGLTNSSATVMNNTFTGNSSAYAGGLLVGGLPAIIEDNTITGNSSRYGPGGLLLGLGKSSTVTENTVSDNTGGTGGGVEITGSLTFTFERNNVSGNTGGNGGGVYLLNSSPTLIENIITGNVSTNRGGGIYAQYANSTMVGNTITANSSRKGGEGTGGGVFLYFGTDTLTRNTISGNSAETEGGGVYLYRASSSLVNNLITDNRAQTYGGVYATNASPTLTNDTVAFNSPGGFYGIGSGTPLITNCILWGNTGAADLTGALATYSDVGTGNTAGTGNLSTDPLFAGAGDYHLQSMSPCIDKGNNEAPALPSIDKDGNPRIIGVRVDMGAYESQNEPPVANAGPDQTVEQASAAGTPVALDGSGSSDANGDALTYTWTGPFPEGGGMVHGVDPTVTLQLGTNSITLVVNDGQVDSAPDSVDITVQDTTAPELTVPPDVSAEQTSLDGTTVEIGMASATDICDSDVALGNDAPGVYPHGETVVTWIATDDAGNQSIKTQKVTIADTTPPEIESIAVNPSVLTPPNHKMVEVEVFVHTFDICDASPVCRIVSVTSNESINGPGDGNTAPDWEITGDLTVELRAERSGDGTGRVYTIHLECTDASGNTATATVDVTVPHDQREQSPKAKGK